MAIISRSRWGARYGDGNGDRPLPASEAWLHHSVTIAPDIQWVDADGDNVDDDEERAMRAIEDIGRSRFGSVYGFPYTFAVMPSGRVYQGHAVGQQGAHTANHNYQAIGIVFVGNYEDNRPTDAQLTGCAWLLRECERRDWLKSARLNGGHRDTKSTACPGRYAYAAIDEINRRAAAPIQEEDMPLTDADVNKVWDEKAENLRTGRMEPLRAMVQYAHANAYDAEIAAKQAVAELVEVRAELATHKQTLAEILSAVKGESA